MFCEKAIAVAGIVAVAAWVSVYADVIDPNFHLVARCVVIENGDEFPDIALVGAYTGPTVKACLMRYIVHPDSCLTKGYKFNSFYLFWVEKSYLETQGLDNLPLQDLLPSAAKRRSDGDGLNPMGLIGCAIEPFGGVVPDTNLVVRERLVYRLSAASGGDGFECSLAEKTTVDKNGYENRVVYAATGTGGGKRTMENGTLAPLLAGLSRGYLLLTPGFSGKVAAELVDCRGRSVARFNRECRSGYTYLVRSAGNSDGIYWLRVRSEGVSATLPVHRFR